MSSTIPDAADRRAPPVPLSNSEHHPIPESSRPRAVSLSWICHIKVDTSSIDDDGRELTEDQELQTTLSYLIELEPKFWVPIRLLWRHYFQNMQGIIFVVYSYDRDCVVDAMDEFHGTLNEVKFCLE
ncbi:hypothetical protein EJB05_37228 [Eragrostis curvula]|uniref:Uncharacterized protein n=1 Tax=Eragrostis curvula TaxID=38414 RepID=A0A5J9TR13_9POAL|nr:hypothetical protein EJB05_37228 [Eragrostis curvula]